MKVHVVIAAFVDGDEPWVHGVYRDRKAAERAFQRVCDKQDWIVRVTTKRVIQRTQPKRGRS